jgi:pyridoxine 4-dehydrogenase
LSSVETSIKKLGGQKKIDLFEAARIDPNVPVEETIKILKGFIEEGLFDYIGVSEVSADTLRRAHKVRTTCEMRMCTYLVFRDKVHPISIVEIEISPWSFEDETKKGRSLVCRICLTATDHSHPYIVVATAKELGVTVLGYSPLGRGFLTGKFNIADLNPNDYRFHLPRFQQEVNASHHKQSILG